MKRKLIAAAAAFSLALGAVAPSAQAFEHRRDGYDGRGGYGRDYRDYNNYGDYRDHDRRDYRYDRRHRRDRDDHDDAVAAGVIGLVLGLALGAAASSEPKPRGRCYDNYQRCEPARGYDDRYGPPPQDDRYRDGYYSDRPSCTRRERQWDRYAQRYVTVDVPC